MYLYDQLTPTSIAHSPQNKHGSLTGISNEQFFLLFPSVNELVKGLITDDW